MVTHPLWVQESRVQSPAPAKDFMFDSLFCCCCVFTFCPKTHYLSFYNINLLSILNILQDL